CRGLGSGEEVAAVGEAQVVQVRDAAEALGERPAWTLLHPLAVLVEDLVLAVSESRPLELVLTAAHTFGAVVSSRAPGAGVGVAQLDADRTVRGQHPPPLRCESEQRVEELGRGRFLADLLVLVG